MIQRHVQRTSCLAQSRPLCARQVTGFIATLILAGLLLMWHSPSGATAQQAPSGSAPEQPANQDKSKDTSRPTKDATVAVDDAAAMALFLDRLMMAESGGRDDARNPRSTAVGPFQFIESTFLDVTRRHFPAEIDEMSAADVLKLRTNREFARRAAEAFTRDNAALLAVAGVEASFANLRLAHLVGPGGAVRILKAPASTPIISILGGQTARANPFLVGMTTGDLVRWSVRNLSASALGNAKIAADPKRVAGSGEPPAAPAIRVRCNRALASCRRWVALAKQRQSRPERVARAKRQR
ncbi:MAG: hypothetical protein AB7E81_10835 [Hyphomicrobiaceae bacterium]